MQEVSLLPTPIGKWGQLGAGPTGGWGGGICGRVRVIGLVIPAFQTFQHSNHPGFQSLGFYIYRCLLLMLCAYLDLRMFNGCSSKGG